jgi:hypothetical protein
MSIVRVGLAETKGFSDGYEAIFGKKDDKKAEAKTTPPTETEKKDTPPQDQAKK